MKYQMDEMQEQKLLKIEHNMAWLAFWGLLAIMIVQMILGGVQYVTALMGEWLVFMSMCLYMIVACLRAGIWDRKLTPDSRTNFVGSLLGATVVGIVVGVVRWRYDGDLAFALAIAGGCFLLTMVLCFGSLSLAAKFYKNKVKKLEEGPEEE